MKYTGTITRFLAERSFGFIYYGGLSEIFFHQFDASGFQGIPQRGEKVSFEIMTYRGRPKAFNVKPLSIEGASNEN